MSGIREPLLSSQGDVLELRDLHSPDDTHTHTPIILDSQTKGRWSHQHLDSFFKRVYAFYKHKGLTNIILSRCFKFLNVLFLCFVVVFLGYLVDYHALAQHVRHRNDPCPGLTDKHAQDTSLFQRDCLGYHPFDLHRIKELPVGVYVCLAVFASAWAGLLLAFLISIPKLIEMHRFYTEELKITERDLQTIPWSHVMQALIDAQSRLSLCTSRKELTSVDITNLIMRRVNFMIALYADEALDIYIKVPFVRRVGSKRGYPFLPQQLEWNIDFALKNCIFDSKGDVNNMVKSDEPDHQVQVVQSLRRHLFLLGIFNLLLAPVILVYRIAHFCFHHSDLKSKPGTLGLRQWTPFARWRLREFCEVEHYFQKRLNLSYEPSVKYLGMFTSETFAIIANFVLFLCGGVLLFLVVLGVVFDEEILFLDLTPSRSLTWWSALATGLVALARGLIPDPNLVFDPVGQLRRVTQHTHYMPRRWRMREASLDTYEEFSQMFQLKAILFVEEIASVVMTPLMLMFWLPGSAERIAQFFRNHTTRIRGIGDVCSSALMEAPSPEPPASQAPEGALTLDMGIHDQPDGVQKMHSSMMNFKHNHPQWEPQTATAAEMIRKGRDALTRKYPDAHRNHNLAESLYIVDEENEEEQAPLVSSMPTSFRAMNRSDYQLLSDKPQATPSNTSTLTSTGGATAMATTTSSAGSTGLNVSGASSSSLPPTGSFGSGGAPAPAPAEPSGRGSLPSTRPYSTGEHSEAINPLFTKRPF